MVPEATSGGSTATRAVLQSCQLKTSTQKTFQRRRSARAIIRHATLASAKQGQEVSVLSLSPAACHCFPA